MNPFTLPPPHVPSLRRWLLGAVMTLANQWPERDWYTLKARLLIRYGVQLGYDLQKIEHQCWDCEGAGCRRCIKGIYRTTRTKLARWSVGGWVMHTPVRGLFEFEFTDLQPGAHSIINGYIRHGGRGGYHLAGETQLWLLLIWGRTEFKKSFLSRCFCDSFPYPLLTVQEMLFNRRVRRHQRERAARIAADRQEANAQALPTSEDDIPF